MMAFLGVLLASNILSFNVLAVIEGIGGQEMSVTVLNLVFGVALWFKHFQKQNMHGNRRAD